MPSTERLVFAMGSRVSASMRVFMIHDSEGDEVGRIKSSSERDARDGARQVARANGAVRADGVLRILAPVADGYERVTFVRAVDDSRPLPDTREECIAEAAAAIAEGRRQRDTLPVKEAARIAYTPSGPSLEELERRIAARRAGSAE